MPSQLMHASLLSFVGIVAGQKPANPIKVSQTQFLGAQRSSNDAFIHRDGGSEGHINNTYWQIYADTSQCSDAKGSNCVFVAPNTIAAESFDPLQVTDYDSPTPSTFCNTQYGRLHMANLVPTGPTSGAIWYVNLTSSSSCKEINGCPSTLGVASVTVSNGRPSCTPLFPFWDPTSEPQWGGTAALGPALDGYFYLLGSLDAQAPGGQLSDVYIARVKNGDQFNYGQYQYWNGSAFTSTRIRNPVYNNAVDIPSILQNVSVGSWFYSSYYNRYVAISAPQGNQIVAHTAVNPQGPYSDPVTIWYNTTYDAHTYNSIYLPQALPARDQSGKTLTIVSSYAGTTNLDVVIKLTFQ